MTARLRWRGPLDQAALAALLPEVVARLPPAYWQAQRWFASKGQQVVRARLVDLAPVPLAPRPSALALADVDLAAGSTERYLCPWVAAGDVPPLAVVETPAGMVPLSDALDDGDWPAALVRHIAAGDALPGQRGVFRCSATHVLDMVGLPDAPAQRLGVEQSNTSLRFGDRLILKCFRKLQDGVNPDLEVSHFLTTRTTFRNTPLLAGAVAYEAPDFAASIAILQTFVPNKGDAWAFTLAHLEVLRTAAARERPADVAAYVADRSADYLAAARRLGAMTAALHLALASDPATPAFAPEPISPADAAAWVAELADHAARVVAALVAAAERQPAHVRAQIARLATLAPGLSGRFATLEALPGEGVQRIRHHGDYHLGQVLWTGDDFVVIDFEGEPARPIAARRAKHCALRDVAGMLRSLDYARHTALGMADGGSLDEPVAAVLAAWQRQTAAAYLSAYRATARDQPFLPRRAALFEATLAAFELDKALYEAWYELNNRPSWLPIPLAHLASALGNK